MLEAGLSCRSRTVVCESDTAAAVGSGDMPVFATPAMTALMENAAMLAVARHLPEGATTVGSRLEVDHLRPSRVGAEVVATAVLTEIDGRKLTFNVGARDEQGLIGEGVHVRYVVDRGRFLAKL